MIFTSTINLKYLIAFCFVLYVSGAQQINTTGRYFKIKSVLNQQMKVQFTLSTKSLIACIMFCANYNLSGTHKNNNCSCVSDSQIEQSWTKDKHHQDENQIIFNQIAVRHDTVFPIMRYYYTM